MTPLLCAIRSGKISIIATLCEAGADLGAINVAGRGALHIAAAVPNGGPILKDILRLGPTLDVNALTEGGETALHVAAKSGCEASVSMLLEKGANVDLRDSQGYTPAMMAARYGHFHIMDLPGLQSDEAVRISNVTRMRRLHQTSQPRFDHSIPVPDVPEEFRPTNHAILDPSWKM